MKKALEYMNDIVKNVQEELVKIDLNNGEGEEKLIKISKGLSEEERRKLIALLRKYKDVFTWSYQKMPGLSPNLVTYKLKVDPNVKPVKQPPRNYRLDVEEKIKSEVNKLLKVGSIEEIECPSWLANIIPVKKKGSQIRIYVDFRDLNKACPKDEFTLPNVDILVDATASHECFSFMDGYSGYNLIFMEPADAQKTAFRTPFGNYFYKAMPFGLKNASATYQRTVTLIFGDMLHKQVEDYVNDLVVKAKNPFEHLLHLRQVFKRCREHNLRMNSSKWAFGVSSRKFLSFLVCHRGIDLDPTKAKAIAALNPSMTLKKLRSFV